MATHTFKADGQEATQDATFANDQLTIGDVAYTIAMDAGAELGNGHATLNAADGAPLVGTLAPIAAPAPAPAPAEPAAAAADSTLAGGRRRRKSAKKAAKKSSKKRRSSKKKRSSKKR
jgi:hypothetical protein